MASPTVWTTDVVEKNVDADLKCPICFEFYTSPVMLPCTHVVCHSCIERLLTSGYMNCPICQTDLQVHGGLVSLVTLHLLARIVEVYTSQDSDLSTTEKLLPISIYLKCPKCKVFFTSPVVLPCTHIVCGRCCDKMLKRERLKCPICKIVSDVPSGTDTLVNIPPIERITETYKEHNALSDKNMKSGAGVCRSTGSILACVVLGLPISIAMLEIGYLLMDQCPIDKFIPIFLFVMGVVSLWLALVVIFWLAVANENCRILAAVLIHLTTIFMVCWLIAGCVWIFSVASTVQVGNSDMRDYCNRTLYLFAFCITTLTLFSLFLLLITFGIYLAINQVT